MKRLILIILLLPLLVRAQNGNLKKNQIDTTDVTGMQTKLNSLALSALQTKFNLYALSSSIITYTGSAGIVKTANNFTSDTTFNRTVTNSLSLAALQTKFNLYPLKTTTLTAGVGIQTIGDLSAGRTVAADTSVLRTVANSQTLAQTQTALNLRLKLADTTAMLANLVHINGIETINGGKIFNANALGTTANSQVTVGTSTAAAVGAQQLSGGFTLQGNGWGTTAGTSQATQFRLYTSPSQSTVPTAGLNIDYSVAGGSFNQRFIFGSTGSFTMLLGSIAATSTDGLLIRNATASTAGVPVQNVGRINMLGHVWNTTATAADNQFNWIMEARGVSGTTPTSSFYLASSLTTNSTTSFTDRFSLSNTGIPAFPALTTNGLLQTSGGVGTVGVSNTLPSTAIATTQALADNSTSVSTDAYVVRNLLTKRTTNAINSTNTATATQWSNGYITSTSAAPTTITFPTATLCAGQVGSVQGTTYTCFVDNSAGASTVTIVLGAGMTGVGSPSLTITAGSQPARYDFVFTSGTACGVYRPY